MPQVKITLDGKQHEFEVRKDQKILDAALDAGIDAPYSCRSAICSTCMAKLVSGEVKMEMNYVLTDQEIDEGYIVTCQALPITDVVELDYDA